MYKVAKWIDTHYDNKWQCPKLFIKTFHFTFYEIIVYSTLLWHSRLRIFEKKWCNLSGDENTFTESIKSISNSNKKQFLMNL